VESSLLATKLFILPVAPGLVLRPHLVERLNGVINSRLTLISAPAGFGKTTLVSQWARSNAIPIAWLSLEEAENDPVRFWDYFISALRKIEPTVGEISLRSLLSPERVPIESILIPLINDISGISTDHILVLDDYHFIQSQPIHHGLTYFLEHMPPCMHLIITTRVDPPLPLARFRGRGILLEIGADDLRFSEEETRSLFTAMDFSPQSTKTISILNKKTEGWVVGLKMAILSMKRERDIPAFIASFSGSQRYIMDYLIEEVLQRLTPEFNNFLLKTSVLEKLNGSLCDAVTGRDKGRETLLELERENLFIVSLDTSHDWYRYEHLFTDLLRHRLELSSGKELVREFQKKASYWCEQNGFKEDAINYALAAGDWTKGLDLILNITPNLINTYGTFTTYSWLRQIPQEILLTRQRAWRYYVYTLTYTGNYDTAKTFLDKVEEANAGDPGQAGYIAASRSEIAFYHNDPQTEEYASQALSLLPAKDILQRAVISSQLGVHYLYAGRFSEAEPLLTEGYRLHCQNGNNVSAGFVLSLQAIITLLRGKLHLAEEMCMHAIQMARPYTESPGEHVVLGWINYEKNDLPESAAEFEKAIELSTGSPIMMANAGLRSVPLRLAQGDIQAAVTILKEAKRVWNEDSSPQDRAMIAGYEVAVANASGINESVSRWLGKFCDYSGFILTIPAITLRLLHERKNETSEQRIKTFYDVCRKENLQYYLIMERLGQAAALQDSNEALSLLGDGLTMGRQEGFIRIFVDWGISLAPLLRFAISRGIEVNFSRMLLDIIVLEQDRNRAKRNGTINLSAESIHLSKREMEVLRLVAQGLSNRQIADRLFVTPGTIKIHVYNFTKKLNAVNRTQAVRLAQERKLL
jgi:LuxR family transcriptional regulator, maltose regulon positive regulatory protein